MPQIDTPRESTVAFASDGKHAVVSCERQWEAGLTGRCRSLHLSPHSHVAGTDQARRGPVDRRNCSVYGTVTMLPWPRSRIALSSSIPASRPMSRVGWRTVVRVG